MKSTHPPLPDTRLMLLAIVCVLSSLGCERRPRVGRHSCQWRSTRTRVHGIDDGSAFSGRYGEGTAMIIWTDILACGFPIEPAWDKIGNRAEYVGNVKPSGGSEMDVECHVTGRMAGSMKIGEQEYDLASGSLFLISFRSSPIRIRQVNRDIYDIAPLTVEWRKQLVEERPEIKAFFEARYMQSQWELPADN